MKWKGGMFGGVGIHWQDEIRVVGGVLESNLWAKVYSKKKDVHDDHCAIHPGRCTRNLKINHARGDDSFASGWQDDGVFHLNL